MSEITDELKGGKIRTHHCTYAMRASLVQKAGGFREFFQTGEDLDFQLRLSESGRVLYVPENWYLYRLHATSITHTQQTTLREFFARTALELQSQRRQSGADDLQRGNPPPIPNVEGSQVNTAKAHVQGLLLGRAWREHGLGQRMRALRSGARALAAGPMQLHAWRSVAALVLKPAGGNRDQH